MDTNCGKTIRLSRIINPESGKSVSIALDHGLTSGPLLGLINPLETLKDLLTADINAVVLSPGMAKILVECFAQDGRPALIVRLDWTNMFRLEKNYGYKEGRTRLIAGVEDAIRLGADAVLCYMFFGFNDPDHEAWEVEKSSKVIRSCEHFGMPCILEPMARGMKAREHRYDPDMIKIQVRNAVELGADIIKTDYTGSKETFESVIQCCPKPILIAGGPKSESIDDVLRMADGAVKSGAAGTLFGRNIFQANNPVGILNAIKSIVHHGTSIEDAANTYLSI